MGQVHGKQVSKVEAEDLDALKTEASKGPPGWGKLIFLAGGTLAAFTVFGYAQEALTSHTFGGERFGFTSFLVLVQSVGNSAIGAGMILSDRDEKNRRKGFSGGVPMRDWLVAALGYLGAHKFGLWALSYISFPLQVVCKSCKAIPVMFGEKIFAGATHSLSKKLSVFLMSAGVVVFTLFGKGGGHGGHGGAAAVGMKGMIAGLGLVFAALACDGLYGPYQNKIVQQYKPSAYHLMFNMNLWQGVFSAVMCLLDGEMMGSVRFIQKHPEVIGPLVQFSAAMGVGNLFIYNLQREFGALTVTTTTTIRKLLSVVFSVLWFGHSLGKTQWAGVAIVFLASPLSKELAKVFESSSKKKALEEKSR